MVVFIAAVFDGGQIYKAYLIWTCSRLQANSVCSTQCLLNMSRRDALCTDNIIRFFLSRQVLKGTLGFPLVRFEDAVVTMYPFTRVHPYETQEIIINDIIKHFREV